METKEYLQPVDGKFVYQVDKNMRVRFNADGWVEEIGRGGADDPMGTEMHGKPSTKLDSVYVRRFYDLYSRVMIIDINSKQSTYDIGSADGLVLFKDLDPESRIYERIKMIIEIGNENFNLGIKPLA